MKLYLYILLLSAIACNSTKKTSNSDSTKEEKTEEVVQQESIDLGITDSIFLFHAHSLFLII